MSEWPAPVWGLWSPPESDAVFSSIFAERKLPFLDSTQWATDKTTLGMDSPLLSVRSGHECAEVVELCGALAHIQIRHGDFIVRVAANERAQIVEALDVLLERFPRSEAVDGRVPVTFWTYGPMGPGQTARKIAAQPWGEIGGNYATPTASKLDAMMSGFRPSHGGQLILWQGEPGTGKTHALRSLAWEWREWADLHYVIDPDKLFGDHADYLITVLLSGESDADLGDTRESKWKLLVLEDTGELLAADAKDRTGQGLSRLLNTVDGLIGQGLRILVLVTTNEELKRLNPAVSRPGRCAAQISFEPLDLASARAWATKHQLPVALDAPMSLAELYAIKGGYSERPLERKVGFAA